MPAAPTEQLHGAIDHALDLLRKNGVVYEKDGAEWFRDAKIARLRSVPSA